MFWRDRGFRNAADGSIEAAIGTRAMRAVLSSAVFAALLAGCGIGVSYSTEDRHEAFKVMYSRQVGLNADDPDRSWLARYPEDIIDKRVLPNGNTEVEFAPTHWPHCRVFYEVDPETRIIVGWRFEGSKQDCRWLGP